MSKSGKSHKSLIVGIVGAVVVLAVLLTVLLTQCMGQEPAATAPTVEPTEQMQPGTYTLYWNLDRAQYDGKSEAGMSGRMPESDGITLGKKLKELCPDTYLIFTSSMSNTM